MKKFLSIFVLILLFGSGCSSLPNLSLPTAAVLSPTQIPVTPAAQNQNPTAAATATVGSVTEQATTALPTMVVLPKIDPEKTVSLFLDGQKAAANFALTSSLLSAKYAAALKDDAGLKAIFGKDAVLGEYKVGSPTISEDALTATLESTIYMPQAANIRFSLVLENGEWKIDDITVLSTSGEYPSNPEGVVLGFLTSYQESPDRMSNFLISSRRSQLPPGGATAMLQINGSLEGMVIQSAAVSPEPPTASIIVTIRAGGKDYLKKFLLTRDTTGWGIDAIESVSE